MKILSIIEATTVTGPAKNLLNFCRLVQSPDFSGDNESVKVSIVTFHRGRVDRDVAPNAFVAAAREMGFTVDVDVAGFVAEVVLTFMFLIIILGATDGRAPNRRE